MKSKREEVIDGCPFPTYTIDADEPYVPGEYFGEIKDHGVTVDSSGRTVFWLDYLPTDGTAVGGAFLYLPDRVTRIVFDGTVSIKGQRASRIHTKVRAAIQQLCADQDIPEPCLVHFPDRCVNLGFLEPSPNPDSPDTESPDPYGLIGQALLCRCRNVKTRGGLKERWSVLDLND
jgi:hypothetical protein